MPSSQNTNQRFLSDELSADPTISHILNLYIKDNTVVKNQFNKAMNLIKSSSENLGTLEKSVTAVKKTAD